MIFPSQCSLSSKCDYCGYWPSVESYLTNILTNILLIFWRLKNYKNIFWDVKVNPNCKFQNKYLKENVLNFVTFLIYLPWQYLNICFIFFKVQGLFFSQITWIVLLFFLLCALHFYIENCSAYFDALFGHFLCHYC